ncbi:MAG: translation initiation factor IF-3 [Candidatus Dormibacteria bacterium]
MNDQIRVAEVRLVGDDGEQLGIVTLERALELAVEREVDLVEVAPQAVPPVCRLMDYGRYKFEAIKKEKEARRRQNTAQIKEMKLRPKISENDYQTKFKMVRQFLEAGDKVKLTIMFRGREMVHQELGRRHLDRIAAEVKPIANVERSPLVEGRNMIMILSPIKRHDAPAAKPEQKEKSEAPVPAEPTGPAQ